MLIITDVVFELSMSMIATVKRWRGVWYEMDISLMYSQILLYSMIMGQICSSSSPDITVDHTSLHFTQISSNKMTLK